MVAAVLLWILAADPVSSIWFLVAAAGRKLKQALHTEIGVEASPERGWPIILTDFRRGKVVVNSAPGPS